MRHIPVLLDEVLELLQLKPGMNIVDCTLGDGGHAEAMLEKIGPKGKLLGIDADPESLLRAKQYLYRFGDQVTYVRNNFVHLKRIAVEQQLAPVSAILMDLGWSSSQFEERGRGFSFAKDEPLDMRYDASQKSKVQSQKSENDGATAADIVNTHSEQELAKIFKQYGEEKLSKEIASAIVEHRKKQPIERTGELVEIVLGVYRQKLSSTKEVPWVGGFHPATKVFQALRIAVNQELEAIRQALPQAVEILSEGGRLAVISFHSLEDRIVKQYFKGIDGTHGRMITKKPIVASAAEATENPRARSAKLRAIEKISQ